MNTSTKKNNHDHGSPIIEQARDVASKVKSKATELVMTRVSRRQEQSAMELTSLANVLREKGEELEDSILAPLVGGAANQIDRASTYLEDASLKDVVGSTDKLARREPMLFLGGAFALGVLCARFLRSPAHHEREEQPTGGHTGGSVSG